MHLVDHDGAQMNKYASICLTVHATGRTVALHLCLVHGVSLKQMPLLFSLLSCPPPLLLPMGPYFTMASEHVVLDSVSWAAKHEGGYLPSSSTRVRTQ